MKILFDHQIYSNQKFGGISRYFYELSRGIKSLGHEIENTIKYSENVFTDDKDIFKYSKKLFYNYKGKGSLQSFLNKKYSIQRIRENDFDVFHPTYYDTYFVEKKIFKKPFVLTFHDLIHEKFGHEYPDYLTGVDNLIKANKLLLNKASKVIAISESTKNDIIDYYKIDPAKIEVVYLASSLKDKSVPDKLLSNLPYILFVGNRGAYKNFSIFIESVSELLKLDKNIRVICAGGGSFDAKEIEYFKKLGIENQISYRPITSDEGLASLYSNALMFVFPSRYEGFGIPTLEAFNCGCAVVLSNISSLPEVGGDAALYIDPQDPHSIHKAVKLFLYDSELRNKYKNLALERSKKFNWATTVEKTVDIYQSLV
ncbi:glycosyltransferase family 1 protein [Siphonobacter sp. SORGH_AS_0500]|uniref:glycosyltransferase family 4 protein n=1 Tax=Siphonobacter sp. SORGH_AS_0500 TaxID=1864824 RepID=UPI00285F8A62|nr:glycosyltransferase family 1 protein [Siphonobacter sp. SORGH_AS_0500]MDR6193705.1 glycosyltransferase involved in cell wall biosynthesis [Siphonobacter sp. SORGH_AS_0500]